MKEKKLTREAKTTFLSFFLWILMMERVKERDRRNGKMKVFKIMKVARGL